MTAPTRSELAAAYAGRRVLVTGHTGFKGAWLLAWLRDLGATVTGLALAPDTTPSLFDVLGLAGACDHHEGDVRDAATVRGVVRGCEPEVVFHLAAQPLVRLSYEQPVETMATNVMGTAHVLDALRCERTRAAVVIVTSDKCYENREWVYGYREDEPMGGHDPYSASKGAAELVVQSFRRSFFAPQRLKEHGVAVATARAGNVIGGGDWALDRIVPDAVRALGGGRAVAVRNPMAVRPWQHVLEPLSGYLLLGARLLGVGTDSPARYCEGWNFGPSLEGTFPVRSLMDRFVACWGEGSWEDRHDPSARHEARTLRLSIEKAVTELDWRPRWGFEDTVQKTAAWYRAHRDGASREALASLCQQQIHEYLGASRAER